MRFKGFMRKVLDSGTQEFCGFSAHHFKAAGIGYAPQAGMPVLEAYQLVNGFNRSQAIPRFIYWLE